MNTKKITTLIFAALFILSSELKASDECFEKTSRAIFKFNMGFDNAILEDEAKIGILFASIVAAIIGTLILYKSSETKEVSEDEGIFGEVVLRGSIFYSGGGTEPEELAHNRERSGM